MFRTIVTALIALGLFTSVNVTFAATQSTDTKATKTFSASRLSKFKLSTSEQRLVNAVNEYRAERGLAPLKVDRALMSVARDAAPYYSHEINGQMCWHRARAAGFRGWATDNIANGCTSPEHTVQAWAESDGHARQMRGLFNMNRRWQNYHFNRIGVGISGNKYIAVFGREERKAKPAKSPS